MKTWKAYAKAYANGASTEKAKEVLGLGARLGCLCEGDSVVCAKTGVKAGGPLIPHLLLKVSFGGSKKVVTWHDINVPQKFGFQVWSAMGQGPAEDSFKD